MGRPATRNLEFYQGDDERFTVFWENPPGTPADDLTGAAVEMQIRRGPADEFPEIIAKVSIGDGATISDGPGAEIELFFKAAKTVLLTCDDKFEYANKVTAVGGDKKTIRDGKLRSRLERTRE